MEFSPSIDAVRILIPTYVLLPPPSWCPVMTYIWLGPIDVAFLYGLYFLLKNYLVRKLFDPVLQSHERGKEEVSVVNGYYCNGTLRREGVVEGSRQRTLPDGVVARISAL